MPVSRCPSCELIITDEEALAGACPVCAAPLPAAAPPPAPPPPAPPPPPPRNWIGGLAGAAALAALLLTVWLLTRPERQAAHDVQTEDEEQKPQEPERPPLRARREIVRPGDPPAAGRAPEAEASHNPRAPAAPPLRPHFPLVRDDAIRIDGDLDDWKGLPSLRLTAVQRGPATRKAVAHPRTIDAWIAHSRKGLFVAVDAADTSGVLENPPLPDRGTWAFWDSDCLEVFIDTQQGRRRGGESAHQFFVFPFAAPNDRGVGGYESKILATGKKGGEEWSIVPLPQVRRAAKKTPAGWRLEAFIPKTLLRQTQARPGDVVGFELQLDSGTNVFYHWRCTDPAVRASMRPDLWRGIPLGGSDARVEVVGEVTAGKPLTVRLSDADVNLDPAAKEWVSVTLNGGGGPQTLILEETAPDSGVFVGSIATHADAGKARRRSLAVRPGKEVAVEYLDRVRGDGRRDAPVRATFAVAP